MSHPSRPTRQLNDLSSIGPAMLRDFDRLGIRSVPQLARCDAHALYEKLCHITGKHQDPCVLDTFTCAVAQAKDPALPQAKKNWWYWSRLRLKKGRPSRPGKKADILKALVFLTFTLFGSIQLRAEEIDPPNFSLLFHLGGDYSYGYIQGHGAAPSGGFWLGVAVNNRMDGLWGMDYYTMPSVPVTLFLPSPSNPVSLKVALPSDDIALTVNTRWYWSNKWDPLRGRFNTVPYLVAGIGLDLLVDEYPRPPNFLFYNGYYDVLFGANFGAGIDMPMGDAKSWSVYAEAMDHFIFWQGLTQVYSVRVGLRFMLDSAHVDPFRETGP